jgi:hypothetical protein
MAVRRLLRGACVRSRNVLPLETGTTWGRRRKRGRSRETGFSHRYLAPAGGVGTARRLASRCGKAGQGPCISYMEGPCLIFSGRNVFAGTGAARRSRRNASGDDPGHGRVRTGLEWRPKPTVDGGRRVTFQLVRQDSDGSAHSSAPGARSPYRARMT